MEDELQRFDGTWEIRAWLAEGKETSLPGGQKVVSIIQSGKVIETAGDQVQESVLRLDPSQQRRAGRSKQSNNHNWSIWPTATRHPRPLALGNHRYHYSGSA